MTKSGILPVCLLWATAILAHDGFPHGSPGTTTFQQVSMRSPKVLGVYFQSVFFSQAGIVQTDTVVPKGALPAGKRKNDPFSILMAGVVNDTAVLYNTYVDEIPIKDSIKTELAKAPPVKIDSPVAAIVQKKPAKDSGEKKIAMAKTSVTKTTAKAGVKKTDSSLVHPTFVEKLSESLQDSVLELVYVSVSRDGKQDTVNLAIALDKTKKEAVTQNSGPIVKKAMPAETVKDSTKTTEKERKLEKEEGPATRNADSLRKQENTVTAKEAAVDTATKKHPELISKIQKEEKPVTIIPLTDSSIKHEEANRKTTAAPANTNCKNAATDYDVDKLRVKMMAADNDDDKLLIARKTFRTKCFTTNQVKALSEIFPTDEGRYKLFDTAYPFVSDYDHFPELSGLLTSQYYINRFKAMLK